MTENIKFSLEMELRILSTVVFIEKIGCMFDNTKAFYLPLDICID